MVSDEELEADPDAYDCQACPVADALDELQADPENWQAWTLWRRVMSRFTVDTHTVALTMEKMAAEMDADTFTDLIERFAVIYDVLSPPPEVPTRGA